MEQRAQLREAAFEREQETRRLRFKREIFQLEIRLQSARRRQLRPMLAQELWHLRARHAHRRAENFFQLRRQTGGLQSIVSPDPITDQQGSAAAPAAVRRALAPNISRILCIHCRANDEGVVGCARGGHAPQRQDNFPVCFQRGAQRQIQRRLCDRDRAGFSKRDVLVCHQQRNERGEIFRVHLQEGGRFAVRQRFELLDDGVVLRRKCEGASLRQRIQRTPPAAPFRFQHQHHLAARQRLVKVRRKNNEQFGWLTADCTQQCGRFSDRQGRGRTRRSRSSLLRLQPMQSDGDAMRANFPPLACLATIAEILDINVVLDQHRSAIRTFAGLHDAA